MSCIHVVGPNQALVVSGGLCTQEHLSFIIGGYTCVCPMTTQVSRLNLELMAVSPSCHAVETRHGVALTVTGAAQVKFIGGQENPELLVKAAQHFLGKSVSSVINVVLQSLEGHLRAILATMTVEEVYSDREKFAKEVVEHASDDMEKMGIKVVSFVLCEISDEVGYLAAAGKKRTAEVRRDADIGKASAEKEAAMAESEARQTAQTAKYNCEAIIEQSKAEYEGRKLRYVQEVNEVKADAELAYSLREAQLKQNIRKEEIQIEVIQRQKEIEVEEQETLRKEYELQSTIILPSEAKRYQVEVIAEGKKAKIIAEGNAAAQATKNVSTAEAYAIKVKGEAEADAMTAKANAYNKYGSTAMVSMALEALPKIAAEVSAPLAKTEQIILMPGSGGGTTQELTKLAAQLPASIQAVSGVDLSKTLQKMAR